MRRITLTVLSTIAILVLLFGYRTSLGGGAAAQPAQRAHVVSGAVGSAASATTGQGPDPVTEPAAGAAGAAGATGSAGAGPASSGSTGAATGAATTVVAGDTEMTRYGPVQVQVTIVAGKITDVTALVYPTAQRRDQEINSWAIPELRTAVLAAQSAKVDVVSGATYTTEGYLTSLQSALDAAHFQA